MREKLLEQAKHEYNAGERLGALVIEAVVFLIVLPSALVYLSRVLDRLLGLPVLAFGVINVVVGCGLIAAGVLLAWWTIYVQFTVGRGTPVPVMATQQLIIQRPYSYCRNPMALGAIVAPLGVAVLIGSISAAALVATWAALLLTYIKLLEEKEMEARFGDAYRQYRAQIPFIIPRFRRRK